MVNVKDTKELLNNTRNLSAVIEQGNMSELLVESGKINTSGSKWAILTASQNYDSVLHLLNRSVEIGLTDTGSYRSVIKVFCGNMDGMIWEANGGTNIPMYNLNGHKINKPAGHTFKANINMIQEPNLPAQYLLSAISFQRNTSGNLNTESGLKDNLFSDGVRIIIPKGQSILFKINRTIVDLEIEDIFRILLEERK